MRLILFIFLTQLLFACSDKNEFDSLIGRSAELDFFINNLKTTSLTYKKCDKCNSLHEGKIIGHTDRYPPKGNYDRMEINIGIFELDAYQIFKPKFDGPVGLIYFFHLDHGQKKQFMKFWPYYSNRIRHGKSLPSITYVNDTAIITIEYGG